MDDTEKSAHLAAIRTVLSALNEKKDNPYVLKGGTALSLCYGLNRFSEDIDLDCAGRTSRTSRFFRELAAVADREGFFLRHAKDTATTGRVFLDYGNSGRPLKIEVSYRRADIAEGLVCRRNGILVYTLDELASLKAGAYLGRDKIRDLYDICFLCTHYFDHLSEGTKVQFREAFTCKDLEQFDYLIANQRDELIDPDVLADMCLNSFDRLGLLSAEEDYSLAGEAKDVTRAKEALTPSDRGFSHELSRGK